MHGKKTHGNVCFLRLPKLQVIFVDGEKTRFGHLSLGGVDEPRLSVSRENFDSRFRLTDLFPCMDWGHCRGGSRKKYLVRRGLAPHHLGGNNG